MSKISVAMASYNGELYIEKQLLSILNQTSPVDEIIISDDGSTDHTLDIVRRIQRCVPGGGHYYSYHGQSTSRLLRQF